MVQSDMRPRQTLLESLDDTDDDFDGSSPIRPSSAQAPYTGADSQLPPLPAILSQSEISDSLEAAGTRLISDTAAWQEQSSAEGCATNSWGFAAEPIASSPSSQLQNPSFGVDCDSATANHFLSAGQLGDSTSRDGLQDMRWLNGMKASESSSNGGNPAASVQISVY